MDLDSAGRRRSVLLLVIVVGSHACFGFTTDSVAVHNVTPRDPLDPCNRRTDCSPHETVGDPTDCTRYYRCGGFPPDNWYWEHKQCQQDGAHPECFDKDLGTCIQCFVAQCTLSCQDGTAPPVTRPPLEFDSCDMEGTCRFETGTQRDGDPYNCSNYYECAPGLVLHRHCGAIECFDMDNRECIQCFHQTRCREHCPTSAEPFTTAPTEITTAVCDYITSATDSETTIGTISEVPEEIDVGSSTHVAIFVLTIIIVTEIVAIIGLVIIKVKKREPTVAPCSVESDAKELPLEQRANKAGPAHATYSAKPQVKTPASDISKNPEKKSLSPIHPVPLTYTPDITQEDSKSGPIIMKDGLQKAKKEHENLLTLPPLPVTASLTTNNPVHATYSGKPQVKTSANDISKTPKKESLSPIQPVPLTCTPDIIQEDSKTEPMITEDRSQKAKKEQENLETLPPIPVTASLTTNNPKDNKDPPQNLNNDVDQLMNILL